MGIVKPPRSIADCQVIESERLETASRLRYQDMVKMHKEIVEAKKQAVDQHKESNKPKSKKVK